MSRNFVTNFYKLCYSPIDKLHIEPATPTTPIEDDKGIEYFGDHNLDPLNDTGNLRKSLSMSDIAKLGEDMLNLDLELDIKREPTTPIKNEQEIEDFADHNTLDRSFDTSNVRKSFSMSDIAKLGEDMLNLELENNEDSFQRYHRPTGAPLDLSKKKFVSMAEAIYHFERDAPGGFFSRKPERLRSHGYTGPTGLTRPQSPMLRCKNRARSHQHIPTQQEREEQELEEIRKFKIKARPIPKSVIEGPHLPEVPKKPVTIPEPFKLTEQQKKKMQLPVNILKFKARPAPKHILEKPDIPVKPPVQTTKPVSPKFHYIRVKSDVQLGIQHKELSSSKSAEKLVQKSLRHGPVRPEPFSFTKRDEALKKRREERIRRQIEEEKKQAKQFKAQPLPGAVKKQMTNLVSKVGASSTSSENKENRVKFEAKPAKVLLKEPFKPILPQKKPLLTAPFALTTEKRAAQREKFDRQLKEKKEEQERLRQQTKKELQEAEEKAIGELRMKLVHHAKPVPTATPFIPEKSVALLTVPKTPKFVRKLRQN